MRTLITGLLITVAALTVTDAAWAQIAHHPFAIGANEGAVGRQTGLGAWILGQEARFYTGLTGAVRAAKTSRDGLLLLIGLSFAYGIFHAAGPGHGKAVITSYMVSNEVALRRGLVIALCAAVVQGLTATTLVGIAAFVFNATAPRMTATAQVAELASYFGIVILGSILVWRKGYALAAMLRPLPREALTFAQASVPSGVGMTSQRPFDGRPIQSRFFSDDGSAAYAHAAGCDCGHAHMPDPTRLAGRRFDWTSAGIAVVTAGARPCSGAILVLVFSLSQGLFMAGIAATFAMALGTALTTGALATIAVFAKDLAIHLAGQRSTRAAVVGRFVEFAAAACVLFLGLALLTASLQGSFTGA